MATHAEIDTQLSGLTYTPYINSTTGGALYDLANDDVSNNNLNFGYEIDTTNVAYIGTGNKCNISYIGNNINFNNIDDINKNYYFTIPSDLSVSIVNSDNLKVSWINKNVSLDTNGQLYLDNKPIYYKDISDNTNPSLKAKFQGNIHLYTETGTNNSTSSGLGAVNNDGQFFSIVDFSYNSQKYFVSNPSYKYNNYFPTDFNTKDSTKDRLFIHNLTEKFKYFDNNGNASKNVVKYMFINGFLDTCGNYIKIDTNCYNPFIPKNMIIDNNHSTLVKKAYIFDTTTNSTTTNNSYTTLNTFIDGVNSDFNRINGIDVSLNYDKNTNYYRGNSTIDPIEQNKNSYNTSYNNYAAQIERQEQLRNQLQAMQNENTLFTNAYTDISSNMAIASNYSGITDICGTIINNKNIANDLQTQIDSYNKNILSLKDRLSTIKSDLSRNYINNVVNSQTSNSKLKSDVSPTSLYNRLILQNEFLNKSKGDIKNDFTTENAKFLYEIDLYDRFKIINTILMIVYYLVVLRVFYISMYINNNLSNTFIIISVLFFSLYPFVIQNVETIIIKWLKYFYSVIVGNAYSPS